MNSHNKLLKAVNALPYRHPFILVLISILLSCIGGYIYLNELPIISDRALLTSQDLEINRIYKQYREEFGNEELIVLVVQADTSKNLIYSSMTRRHYMKQVARHWSVKLRQRLDLFPTVWERIALSEWNSLALLFLPMSELESLSESLQQHLPKIKTWLESPGITQLLALADDSFAKLANNQEIIDKEQVEILLNSVTDFLYLLDEKLQQNSESFATNGIGNSHSAILSASNFDPEGYFFADHGNLLTAYASINGNSEKRNRYAEAMEFAQECLRQAMAEIPPDSGIDAGIAGMPALEYEEMKTAQQDFARSGAIALLCVTVLFMVAFSSIVRPALAAFCLCLSIGITFAIVWLIIGHLNLLAMIFTVILIALGIDFAIHFTTHYERRLCEGNTPAEAIANVQFSIGGALWMGGITTAAAFLSAYFTEFDGLAELGLIAGIGLIICIFCMYFVYPALLYLWDNRFNNHQRIKETRLARIHLIDHSLNRDKAKWLTALFTLIVTTAFLTGQFRFDTNLLNIQADDSPANHWQRILTSEHDRTLYAVSTFTEPESLKQVQMQFEKADFVKHTESLFPTNESKKRQILNALSESIAPLNLNEPKVLSVREFKRQVWNFRNSIRKYQWANTEAKAALAGLETQITALYGTLTQLSSGILSKRLAQIENAFYQDLKMILPQVKNLFTPPEFSLELLPQLMRSRLHGENGSLALHVFPAANVWEQSNLEDFIKKARKIEPLIIGEIVSLYENGQSIIRSFLQASVYSLMAILVLIGLWSRSIRATFFSLVPLIAGLGLLLGIMHLFSIQWNFTNFFALPILIGTGVDSGVHLVKAWQRQDSTLYQGASKAVFLSSLTTIIGFGILATSNHLGVSSLGLVLFTGIFFVLVNSMILLPAVLKLWAKHRHV